MEDSEALVDTILLRKMRSTIWEWSQSLRSSKNKEKIGNTSKQMNKYLKQKLCFFEKKKKRTPQVPIFGTQILTFVTILIENSQIWGGPGASFFGVKIDMSTREKLSELPGSSCSAPPGKVVLFDPQLGCPRPPPSSPPGVIWRQNLGGSGTLILRLQGGGCMHFLA